MRRLQGRIESRERHDLPPPPRGAGHAPRLARRCLVMGRRDRPQLVPIGIEIANSGHDWGYPDFPLRQLAAVIALCKESVRRNIPQHRVLAHSDVSPGRKKDPGEKFPWSLLASSKVGHWIAPAPIVPGGILAPGPRVPA